MSPISLLPSALRIQARHLETWASDIGARSRLPVLVRILVNSTGIGLESVDFPGNSESQRPGSDGYVRTIHRTTWIPEGDSRWELGCGQNPKAKADDDYKDKTCKIDENERKRTTFVFVTPRRWVGCAEWALERHRQEEWKDVRAYDCNTLEQWLEQSPEGQHFFAQEIGIPTQAVKSLESCWRDWQADCKVSLLPLFKKAISDSEEEFNEWLQSDRPRQLTVAADSLIEGLAFLYAMANQNAVLPKKFGQHAFELKDPNHFPHLLRLAERKLIPILTDNLSKQAFSPYMSSHKAVFITSRNVPGLLDHIELKPLHYHDFHRALEEMGVPYEEVERYQRESGGSITVLRRRLSHQDSVRTPNWAKDHSLVRRLVPVVLAGGWDSANEEDRRVITALARGLPAEDLEEHMHALLLFDDPPVWTVSSYFGMASQVDAFLAISPFITRSGLYRFFEIARKTLSGDFTGQSEILRTGIQNTLVLLSVFGDDYLYQRTGLECEYLCESLVRQLLIPCNEENLQSQLGNLVCFAEAAPDTFLEILEESLANPQDSAVKEVYQLPPIGHIKPAKHFLLFALQLLAWLPEYLARVASILAQLSQEGDDAADTLYWIFSPIMPQTSTSLQGRLKVFNVLLSRFPRIGWRLCLKILDIEAEVRVTVRPKWRPYLGIGTPDIENSRKPFFENALTKILEWPCHTLDTLADLLGDPAFRFPDVRVQIWHWIEKWAGKSPTDSDKAKMRENIRRQALTWHIECRRETEDEEVLQEELANARNAYKLLEPFAPRFRFEGLFQPIVDWGREVIPPDPKLDIYVDRKTIDLRRLEVLSQEFDLAGAGGLAEIVADCRDSYYCGKLIVEFLHEKKCIQEFLRSVWYLKPAGSGDNSIHDSLFRDVLSFVMDEDLVQILDCMAGDLSSTEWPIFLEHVPFKLSTLQWLETQPESGKATFWSFIEPRLLPQDNKVWPTVMTGLLGAGRSYSAWRILGGRYKELDKEILLSLLKALSLEDRWETEDDAPGDIRGVLLFVPDAIGWLAESSDIPLEELAYIELKLFPSLAKWTKEMGIPCVEYFIGESSQFFVELVRDSRKYHRVLKVLKKVRRIPGDDGNGRISEEALRVWLDSVQRQCQSVGLTDSGDHWIGHLLSHGLEGDDGVWPSESVRNVLEDHYSDAMGHGFCSGRNNSPKKARLVSTGEEEEIRIKRQYSDWANATQESHPKVSKLLRELARSRQGSARFFGDLQSLERHSFH